MPAGCASCTRAGQSKPGRGIGARGGNRSRCVRFRGPAAAAGASPSIPAPRDPRARRSPVMFRRAATSNADWSCIARDRALASSRSSEPGPPASLNAAAACEFCAAAGQRWRSNGMTLVAEQVAVEARIAVAGIVDPAQTVRHRVSVLLSSSGDPRAAAASQARAQLRSRIAPGRRFRNRGARTREGLGLVVAMVGGGAGISPSPNEVPRCAMPPLPPPPSGPGRHRDRPRRARLQRHRAPAHSRRQCAAHHIRIDIGRGARGSRAGRCGGRRRRSPAGAARGARPPLEPSRIRSVVVARHRLAQRGRRHRQLAVRSAQAAQPAVAAFQQLVGDPERASRAC